MLEKDILTVSSQLLQKSFVPYGKVPSIAKAFDSLSSEQKGWIAKSDSSLKKNILDAGTWLWSAAGVLQKAPVPPAIQEKPVLYYQYRERLLETVLPMKRVCRDYYIGAISLADSLGLTGNEIDSCRGMLAYVNYAIGDEYDRLNAEIIARTKELSADLSKEEKENIIFQLQDISYELQDKAIQLHEEGLACVRKNNLTTNAWSQKILESLARLNPTKYGRAFYQSVTTASDSSWLVRGDSAAGWNSGKPPAEGWRAAGCMAPCGEKNFAIAHACFLGGATPAGPAFVWKNLFLGGAPRSAEVRVMTRDPYRLFVNGMLILSDTTGKAGQPSIPDSAVGITPTLRGGDNWIAIEVTPRDSGGIQIAVVLTAMIDTTEHFALSMIVPRFAVAQPVSPAPHKADTASVVFPQIKHVAADSLPPTIARQKSQGPQTVKPDTSVPTTIPQTRAEVVQAIEQYRMRETQAVDEIAKEQQAIDRLTAARDSVDAQLRQITMQINLKKGKSGNK